MKKILIFVLIIIIIPFLKAYNPPGNGDKPYVDGEIMVKLFSDLPYSQEHMLAKVLSDFQDNDLSMAQRLSDRLDIFLLEFNPSTISDERLLDEIRSHPFVELAQFNHYLEQRELIPNDIFFDQQWNMHNTGQNSGTPDADIDGPEAWSIGSSGVTATGDSIVIAMVDDGFDLQHEDLKFWKNYNEIPNNNIDDDNNGYKDDFDGWNPWQNSGNIVEKDHGTHTTGIAAARGNNGLGVTGVSMNVKIMPVVYGSAVVEAIVVAGYGYIHEMRALYNETDGDEGAFVVSTNASFGVNNGFPEDYPVWAAVYDSLGMLGILSSGATANGNYNVDEVGDIPTTFTSEFLITVTNTDRYDMKSSTGAYGPVSIDLGAPGTQIYSTKMNNAYGTKTGTSMSAPHVAGAIAYMFSIADANFMTMYHNDPAGMALVIKQYILDGVDPLESLQGITVTGGRLNIYNSAQLMLNPAFIFDPLSVMSVIPPNSLDTVTLSFTNSSSFPVNYNFSYPAPLNWMSLAGPISGTIGENATETIDVLFNSNGYPADTLFTYLTLYWGIDGISTIPVHLYVDPNVGVEEQGSGEAGKQGSIEVWPNPAREVLSFKCLGLSAGKSYLLSIYDISGKKVKEMSINEDKTTEINITDIKSGIYTVLLTTGNDIITGKKFIKN